MGMSLTEYLAVVSKEKTKRKKQRQKTKQVKLKNKFSYKKVKKKEKTKQKEAKFEFKAVKQRQKTKKKEIKHETKQKRIEYGVDAGSIATGLITGQGLDRPELPAPSFEGGGGDYQASGGMSSGMMLGAAGLGLGLIGLMATQGKKR